MTLASRESKPKPAGSAPAGPLAWWKLNETAGCTAANAAGNALPGQVQGQPHWAAGPSERCGALELDGATSWVECADSSGLDFREGISVSAWFKVRRFDLPAQTLLAKGEAWRLQRQGEKGNLEFGLTGPTTGTGVRVKPAMVASKRPVDDGQWHHVVATYDAKRVALYLDGVEEDAVKASGAISLNNLGVTLGENEASRGRFFNGWLAEAQLYDRGLSADEVKKIYEKTK